MARIRSLKIGFYTNEVLCTLSSMHRLLFAGIWLIADKAGRLEDRPARIKAELFPYQNVKVDQLLHGLATVNPPFINRYSVGGTPYIQVINWTKHQKPHSTEKSSQIPPPEVQKSSQDSITVKPQLRTRSANGTSRKKGVGSLDLGSGVLGTGSGVRGTGQPRAPVAEPPASAWRTGHNPHTSALAAPTHRRCDPDAAAACGRGLCVPAFLVAQWRQQVSQEDTPAASAAVRAFIAARLAQLPEGPIGDDPLRFWRAEWSAAHPSMAAAPRAMSRAEASIATRGRVLDRVEGGGS